MKVSGVHAFEWQRLAGLLMLCSLVSSATVSTYLSADDKSQLITLFSSAAPYKDVITAYWSLRGLATLNSLPKDSSSVCQSLKSLPAESAEAIFCANEAAELVNCKLTATAVQTEALNAALTSKKVSSLYHAFLAMQKLKLKVDATQVNAALDEALKADDAPTSLGYSFLLAKALNMDLDKRHSLIEDVYAQADVVDGKYMQFEGGIYTTSLVVEGSYALAAAAKKAPTLKPDQVMQLANYLLSRRHVSKVRSASQMLAALTTLSSNKFFVPVAISLDKPGSTVGAENKKIAVRVGTVNGESIGKVTLTADSGRHVADDAIVLSKEPLQVTSDPSVFELDFTTIKAPFGFYEVQITATPAKPDAKLVGLKGSIKFKVVTEITIDSVQLGVGEKDVIAPQTTKVVYPNKAKKLDADVHQKLYMSFYIKSAATSVAMKAHQVFVRMTHKVTGQEIAYVSTPDDGTKQYKFELNVGAKEKEFGSLSGVYEMALLVGDAIIQNPIEWTVAEVELSFTGQPSEESADSQYKPKPTIEHMFREPEKRPAAIVSNVFTILCIAPFVIMLLMWLKLGINVSNFPMSLSALGFHIGLTAIFFLYYLYWTQLNMFQTIQYLAMIGIPTFLCGNQLLSSIASKKKSR